MIHFIARFGEWVYTEVGWEPLGCPVSQYIPEKKHRDSSHGDSHYTDVSWLFFGI